jgi:hypothetical protein
MAFFRSPLLRRIIYAVAIALALVRFATRSHSEPLPLDHLPERPAVHHTTG